MKLSTSFAIALTLISISCRDKDKDQKKVSASAELATVGTASALHLRPTANLLDTQLYTSNVAIESLKIPVVSVSLQNGGTMYSCSAGTTAGCMVELIGPALSNLLTSGSSGEIATGTYNTAYVQYTPNCGVSGQSNDKNIGGTIKASYQLGGITYYTKATGVSTTAPAEDMSFTFSRCNNPMKLPEPLNVTEGSAPINFKLYIDLESIASGTNASSSANGGPYLGVGSPEISITVDQNSPTVERYLISETGNGIAAGNGCYGLIGLYFTSSGAMFGGHFRSYRQEGVSCPSTAIVGSAINYFSKNADGSYILTDGDSGSGELTTFTRFTAFQRAAHSGSYSYRVPEGIFTHDYAATVVP